MLEVIKTKLVVQSALFKESIYKYTFIGGPATVKSMLRQFLQQTDADELMIVSHIYEQEARIRSYEIATGLKDI